MENFYKVECSGEINKLKHKIFHLLEDQKLSKNLNIK